MNAEFYKTERAVGFFVIFLLIFFILRAHKLRKLYAQMLHSSKTLELSRSYQLPKNRLLKEILFLLGLALVTVSLMRPRWGEKQRTRKIKGVDLCVAIDLSHSMLAEDMNPNRLQYAKREMTLLLESLTDMRVTLVGFAGGAFVSAPLTADLDAVADYLGPLDPSFVSLPSTYLQGALVTCAEALGYKDITSREQDEEKEPTAGAILLVTDGDDSNTVDSDVIEGLTKHKIPVNSYLLGKSQPTNIPLRDNFGNVTGYVKDPESGAVAMTKAEEKTVKDLADKTHGTFYVASQIANFGPTFARELKRFEAKAREEGVDVEKEEQFQIPLLIGIVLLMLEWMITETGGVWEYWRKKRGRGAGKKVAAVVLLLLSPTLRAAGIVDSIQNNFGVFLFDRGRFRDAQTWFQRSVEKSPEERQFLFNWVSARLKKIEKTIFEELSKGTLDQKDIASSPLGQEADELSKILQSVSQDEKDPAIKKQWLYQLSQAYELGQQVPKAIDSYYETLEGPPQKDLDAEARHNLARLLKSNSQSGGGGGGQGGGGGEGGGQGDSDKDSKGDEQGKKKPQDYKGQNFSPDQVKQILQNVGSEERNVIKKKAKDEARKKAKEWGQGGGSAKPW